MNTLTEYLEQLISQHDFEDLSPRQQTQVRAQLGEETYRQMRRVVAGANVLASTAPTLAPDLKNSIKSSITSRYTQSSSIWKYKQVLIGFITGAVLSTLFYQMNQTSQHLPITEPQTCLLYTSPSPRD